MAASAPGVLSLHTREEVLNNQKNHQDNLKSGQEGNCELARHNTLDNVICLNSLHWSITPVDYMI
jgi:hypothetical protein